MEVSGVVRFAALDSPWHAGHQTVRVDGHAVATCIRSTEEKAQRSGWARGMQKWRAGGADWTMVRGCDGGKLTGILPEEATSGEEGDVLQAIGLVEGSASGGCRSQAEGDERQGCELERHSDLDACKDSMHGSMTDRAACAWGWGKGA